MFLSHFSSFCFEEAFKKFQAAIGVNYSNLSILILDFFDAKAKKPHKTACFLCELGKTQ